MEALNHHQAIFKTPHRRAVLADDSDFVDIPAHPAGNALKDQPRRARLGESALAGANRRKSDAAQPHRPGQFHRRAAGPDQIAVVAVEIVLPYRHDAVKNMTAGQIETRHGVYVPGSGRDDILQNEFIQPRPGGLHNRGIDRAAIFQRLRDDRNDGIGILPGDVALHDPDAVQIGIGSVARLWYD